METSPVLVSSVCESHSRLSLIGHSCTPLNSPRTSKAPHRTANKQTAGFHYSLSSLMRLRSVHWLLLLTLFTSFFFEACNGIVVVREENERDPNVTEIPTSIWKWKFDKESWFWDNGTIPYIFDKNLPLRLKRQSVKAMCVWMKQTKCVKFVERTDEQYFLRFQYNYRDPTCNSFVGKVRYSSFYPSGQEPIGQPIELGIRCNRGQIMHELGHSLGFYHEHERLDRDIYVEVDYQFVIKTEFAMKKFNKREKAYWFYQPYDYGSVMHFPLDGYSKDGNHTLIPLGPYDGVIGQRKRLSRSDRAGINQIYTCNDTGANRDMLPESPDFIKDGDWIILSPVGLPRQRVECTRDNCSLSDCAGISFKPGEINECPSNLITIRKAPSNEINDKFIRTGDKIALTWEPYAFPHVIRRPMPTETMFCSNDQPCSSAGTCANATLSSCDEQELFIRLTQKRNDTVLKHSDVVTLVQKIPASMSSIDSLLYEFDCIPSGLCDLRLLCTEISSLPCENLAARFNLYKY